MATPGIQYVPVFIQGGNPKDADEEELHQAKMDAVANHDQRSERAFQIYKWGTWFLLTLFYYRFV